MTSIESGDHFEMGRVVSRTFGVLGANLLPFLLLGALSAAPRALMLGGERLYVADPTLAGLLSWPIMILAALIGCVFQAAIMRKAYQSFVGKESSLGDMLGTGLQAMFPLFLLSICVGFMGFLATLLFLIPGLILITRWSVAGPALVVQKLSPFEAMGRSADLTKGRRWAIFGLLLAYIIALAAIEIALVAVSGASLGAFATTMNNNLYALLVLPLLNAFTVPIAAAGTTSIYYELRATRGGFGADDTAAVFA